MSHIHSDPAVVNAFHVRFNKVEPFGANEFYANVAYDQLWDLPLVKLNRGQISAGTTKEGFKFMLFGSNMGAFIMIENPFNSISYRCMEEFYTHPSMRGMFVASGILRTMAMMDRIFEIPNACVENAPTEIDKNDQSYKGGYEVGYSGKVDNHNTYIETSKNGILWRHGYNDGVAQREADYNS